jgi:hypothetical protein
MLRTSSAEPASGDRSGSVLDGMRVGERADDVQHLDDRARPALRHDERQRVLVRRPDVDEVMSRPSISVMN